MQTRVFPLFAAVALVSTAHAAEFEKDVLPILDARCGRCHMNGESKGGVSLDMDRIEREIGRGKAIVPGDSKVSDLVKLISAPEDARDRMPPKGAPLGEREVKLIAEWVDSGAAMKGEGAPVPAVAEAPKKMEPLKGDWTNVQGKTITATLLRVEGDKAMLQMANGQTYPYPINQLNPDSQEKVKAFVSAGQ